MKKITCFRSMLPTRIVVSGLLLVAFTFFSVSLAAGCQRLQDSRYWPISYLIFPHTQSLPAKTKRALDGFDVNLTEQANGKVLLDIDFVRRNDDVSESTPNGDDINLDPQVNQLYFLEGDMGDDFFGGDTDLGDEAVVMTDLQGCILQ